MNQTDGTTRSDKLAAQIADAILAGDLAPGARLDEQTLATRYHVSRTPVREALRQLAATGLIETRARRGATVARVTADQLDTLFVAMAEIEATCARLAAMGMTPVERRRLQSMHESMGALVEANDTEAYSRANVAFHALIYAGAHNPVIAEFANGLRRRLGPFRRAQFRAAGRLPRSWGEHDAVVRAVLAADVAGAHAAMLHHVSLVEDAFDQVSATAA